MPVRFKSVSMILNLLMLIAVLPVVGIQISSYIEQRQHLIEDAEQEVFLITRSMRAVVSGITDSVQQTLTTLAANDAIKNVEPSAASTLLQNACSTTPQILNISMTTADGAVLAASNGQGSFSLADRRHVQQAISSRRFSAGEHIVTRMGSSFSSFAYALPVLDENGRIVCILTAVLRLDLIEGFLDFSVFPKGSFMAITDHRGVRILYYPANHSNPIGSPIQAAAWEIGSTCQQGKLFRERGSDGMNRVFAVDALRLHPEEEPYLYLWAGIPEQHLLKPLNMSLVRNLLFMALITGLALATARLVGGIAFITPIKRLATVAGELAQGKLDSRSGISGRQGEFGQLARAFDHMAKSLQQNQTRLREQQHHLEEAQRIAHIGSWEWQAQDDRYTWSRELYRIFELDPIHQPSRPRFDEVLNQKNLEQLQSALEETLTSGFPFELEFRRTLRNGAKSWLSVRGEQNQGADGVRGTVLDISARKQAEIDREIMHEQLLHSQKIESIGKLAGGVAHDLNNMLGVIIGHTEIALHTTAPQDQIHGNLQEINKAANRSSNLVRQLLAFARRQTAIPVVVDLNMTISAMLAMLQRLIGEDIRLLWRPADGLYPIFIDPGQIDQILANICINARDAISGTGTIIIETRNIEAGVQRDDAILPSPGSYVQIAISDTGCGMDRETQKRIFEPFFTTKEIGKGAGLGLSTVFGIVSQNDGFIEVTSSPNLGTSFFINFPRHHGQPAPADTVTPD